jgi:H+/Cl- antiporter ClcA
VTARRASTLARLAVPAALVGILSALSLIAISLLADRLEDLLWDVLPSGFGLDGSEAGWIIGVLTVVGLVTGFLVWRIPGHAGPDPATTSLVSAPLPPAVLPGLAIVVVISLGGGVSLGPENPIIAINIALAVWLGRRAMGRVPAPQWVGFAAAGTVGALFATPVGAALMLTETPADPAGPGVWDRLFAPLVAAATGSLTMYVLEQPTFVLDVPAYPGPDWRDLLSAPVIAVAAALVGLAIVVVFPFVHDWFWRLRHPVVMLTLGGLALGVLGAIGGTITLFKGLEQMRELVTEDDDAGRLTVIVVVKGLALLVAASCGFRGGRIFPAVFIGVAIGLLAARIAGGVPVSLAVAAGVLGMLLAVSRSGWLSLFMAATVVGEAEVLPALCFALLPAWLLVTDRPEMELPAITRPPPIKAPPP